MLDQAELSGRLPEQLREADAVLRLNVTRALDTRGELHTPPSGRMTHLGYVIMRHAIRLSGPVPAYGRWIDRIPSEYATAVPAEDQPPASGEGDPSCLAHLKAYRSLMPMAQEANRPMFLLKPAHGAIGAHQTAARDCYADFRKLADELLRRLPDGSEIGWQGPASGPQLDARGSPARARARGTLR